MTPTEHGLLKVCATDKAFSKSVLLVLKILRDVLNNNTLDDNSNFAVFVNKFISHKMFVPP